ncbi:DUF4239 domain-containing protein [Streptomyces sp. XD-27]|uniref:bestrophin-like domain n=1 Tax=Streptomyces sp. XD-27 TaxID=3062779 RepID=UPI0026F40C32|nr:DUF4239 domain-containing protein [Streptomyces sp. XD-27]WKX71599.1 DUF4239 domain-containing protein [Streptomyces sp. XD-27]
MALWLLNHLSTAALTVLVVGGAVTLSVAGSLLVRRRFPSLVAGEHNEMVGVVLGMFAAIYGIILAFVIVTLWEQLEETRTTVDTEATDVSLIVRDAASFPPGPRARMDKAVHDYLHAVVERQWPHMRNGTARHSVTAGQIKGLYTALQDYEPATESQRVFYEQASTMLNDVAAQRRDRLAMAHRQLPPLLQVLVFGGALVIIPLTFLYGIRNRSMQLLFVGSVAALIGFSLLLVVVLDRPFAGDVRVSPAPYMEGSLARFWEGPRP